MGQPGGKLDGRQPAFCTDLMELHRDGGDASQEPVARMMESLEKLLARMVKTQAGA